MIRNVHAGFGRGVSEKDHKAPRRGPTSADPTGEKARAVKARYVGVCRGCGAYTQPRNGKGTLTRTARRATRGRSSGAGRASGCSPQCGSGAIATAGCLRRTTGRGRTPAGVGARRSSDWRVETGRRRAWSPFCSEAGPAPARRRHDRSLSRRRPKKADYPRQLTLPGTSAMSRRTGSRRVPAAVREGGGSGRDGARRCRTAAAASRCAAGGCGTPECPSESSGASRRPRHTSANRPRCASLQRFGPARARADPPERISR